MATALQCPACGHKHRIDGPQPEPSFPCSSCRRPLKVPAQFLAASSPASAVVAVGSSAPNGPGTPTAPSVTTSRPIIGHNLHKLERNRDSDVALDDIDDEPGYFDDEVYDDGPAQDIEDEGVVVPKPKPIGSQVRLTRAQRRAVMQPPLPWWGRALIWMAAFPVGAVLVLVPMRLTRFLSGSYLLGVLSETGYSRFGRLAVALVAWSLVTAALVQLVTWVLRRRRIAKIQDAAGATVDLALHQELGG